jgi:hypothetical protein
MSEAWHQHLQNLTWWEEIDRFFNPAKYSCTTWQECPGPFNLVSILPIMILAILIAGVILFFVIRHYDVCDATGVSPPRSEYEYTDGYNVRSN